MCGHKNIVVHVLLSVFINFVILQNSNVDGQGPVDDFCISCICQEGCAITHAYWTDAGKPTIRDDFPGSADAYRNCFNNYECSSRAIQHYMVRYQRDCNNDGKINCYDHAAIHRLGADVCSDPVPQDYRFQIETCLNGY